jgi:hypothetical protein
MALPATALETGYWECDLQGVWAPYEWPTSALIEQAFCAGRAKKEFALLGKGYYVEFCLQAKTVASAVQVNVETGARRQVRRWRSRQHREAQEQASQAAQMSAWGNWLRADWTWVLLDSTAKKPGGGGLFGASPNPPAGFQFAPAVAAPSPPENTAPNSPCPSKEPYSLGDCCFSESWWPMPIRGWPTRELAAAAHPTGQRSNFALHRLAAPGETPCDEGSGPDHTEWALLEHLWQNGGLGCTTKLVFAYRVQNRGLLHAFAAMRKAMSAKLSGEEFKDGVCREGQLKAQCLWHGTRTVAGLLDICSDGFDRARASTCAFGRGCYFAASSALADKFACAVKVPTAPHRKLKAMLLAAVHVGELVQGTSNMYPPPVKPHSRNGDRFETACDKVGHPGIFVTFKDYQAVPAYIMVYESK